MRYLCASMVAGLVLCLLGCPIPEPQERVPFADPPTVDLVIGDKGLQTSKAVEGDEIALPKVLVYFDVINTALALEGVNPAPDLVLGIPAGVEGVSVGNPVDVELNDGDLYLADQGTKQVYLWRDYRTLNDHAEPDAVLLAEPEQPHSPWELFVAHDCLFVTDVYQGLLVWQGVEDIATGDDPEVVLGNTKRSMLAGVTLDGDGNLYLSWLSGGIEVYYDFVTEYLAGNPLAPDVTLSGPSFLHSPAPVWKVLVANDVLYAHTHSASSTVYVFSPAANLTDNQAPDAVITPALGRLVHPWSMAVAGNTLYVGNMFSDDVGVCGFRPANGLGMGQEPSLMLDLPASGMGPCSNLCVHENILYASSSAYPVCDKKQFMENMNTGDVHLFDQAGEIQDGDQADLVIKGGADFLVPLSIDVERP